MSSVRAFLQLVGEAMASFGASKKDKDKELLPPGKLEEIERQVRREVTERVKREAQEEYEADVQARVAELLPKIEEENRKQLKEELRKATPSPQERARTKEMLRELEVECLVMAETASTDADAAEGRYTGRRRFSWFIILSLLLGFLPALCAMHMRGHSYDTFFFWAVAGPWVIAFIAACIHHDAVLTALKNRLRTGRAISSDYRQLALMARTGRKMHVDGAQYKYELGERVENMRGQVTNLHEKYEPSTKAVEEARRHVRDSIVENMDPESLIQVEVDDANAGHERGEPEAGAEPEGLRREAGE